MRITTLSILCLCPLAASLAHGAQVGEQAEGSLKDAGKEAIKELLMVEMTPQAKAALKTVQDYIVKRQGANGSFTGGSKDPGVDALCTLGLMASGSGPGSGPFGREIAQSVNYLMGIQDNTGFFPSSERQHGMYGHALATLLMTEVWGMTHQPELKDRLRKAVQLIVDSQNKLGGWRYSPKIEQQYDLSVSVMQVMALRGAVEAGIYVPESVIARAVAGIKRCFNEKEGGFGYTGPDSPKYSTTGAGLTALQTVGVLRDTMIDRAIQYIQTNGFSSGQKDWFWYGHYYISVAMFREGGAVWEEYYPKIRKIAIDETQKPNLGRFQLYEVSFIALVLAMPYRYIPIYQR